MNSPTAVATAATISSRVPNMSAVCREWYAKNPRSAPGECVAALEAAGIRVTNFIAQQVRYQMRKKRRLAAHVAHATRRAVPIPAITPMSTPIAITPRLQVGVSELREARQFAIAHGGPKRARMLLTALEMIGVTK